MMPQLSAILNDFYPRPPRGGRPLAGGLRCNMDRHFYPRPPRGGRPADFFKKKEGKNISIHALREEGDRIVSEDARRQL